MRITLANIALFFFLITCLDSCKDPNSDPLPPITSTGAGTFGCKINGEKYLPVGSYSGALVQYNSTLINVLASGDAGNFNLVVRDTVNEIVPNKEYVFTSQEKGVKCNFTNNKICRYDQDPITGFIKFSQIDYNKHIISGVFEFTAKSPECNDIIHITEGRFDLRTDL